MAVIQGNALAGFPLADKSVQTIVTSPPYWGQRCYDPSGVPSPDEYGTGSLAEYLNGWFDIAYEAWRVLDDTGTFWLNIGDTAAGSGGAGGDHNKGSNKAHIPKYRQGDPGIKKGQFCQVPRKLADVMQQQGFLLRSEIIWDKGRVERQDLKHIRRPRIQHEMIFLFAKSNKYQFAPERMIEPASIWHFPPNATGDKGFAPFPDELARRCILPSTEPGQVVFDPFSGSGTTPRIAAEMGRVGIGLELYA